jgi:hypothetical protein
MDPKDLEHLKHEYALNLVNHRYEIDWLVGLVIAQRLNLLEVNFILSLKKVILVFLGFKNCW